MLHIANCYSPLERRTYNLFIDDEKGIVVSSQASHSKEGKADIDCNVENLAILPCSYNMHTHLPSDTLNLDLRNELTYIIMQRLRRGVCGGIIEIPVESLEESLRGISSIDISVREKLALGVYIRVEEIVKDMNGVVDKLSRLLAQLPGRRLVVGVDDVVEEPSAIKHFLEKTARLKTEILLDFHVSRTKEELYSSREKHGKYPVEMLYSQGLLNNNTILSCSGWITTWELDLVKEVGSTIVFCPTVQAYSLSGGLLYYDLLAEKHVRTAIGTCNDATRSVWLEAWTLLLLQRQVFAHSTSMSEKDSIMIAASGGGLVEASWPPRPRSPANFLLYPREKIEKGYLLQNLAIAEPRYIILSGKILEAG